VAEAAGGRHGLGGPALPVGERGALGDEAGRGAGRFAARPSGLGPLGRLRPA
jgi:hypothetical protein